MKENKRFPNIEEKEAFGKNDELEIFQKRPINLKHLKCCNLKFSIQCFVDSRKGSEKCKYFIESIIHKSNSVIAEEIAFTEAFLADSYSTINKKIADTNTLNNDTTTSVSSPMSNKEKRAAKAAKEAVAQRNSAIRKEKARHNEALSFINSANLILEERLESIKATTIAFINNYNRKVKISLPEVEVKFDETPMNLYRKAHENEQEVKSNEKQ